MWGNRRGKIHRNLGQLESIWKNDNDLGYLSKLYPKPAVGAVKKEFSLLHRILLEKAMAPHSSTLAWKIPWTEEPGRLQSLGLLRVRHDFTFTFTFHFHALEEMATHSRVLAWRIPGMGEPGGLPSMGSHRVG